VLTFNAATGTFEPAAGGGGGGAPTAAEYLVGALHAGLSAERLVTDTATVAWDLATPGQAKANVASVPGHTHGPGDITGLPWDIGEGGTGQTTQTAAFDALSPTTTKGDVIASDGSDNVRLPVGSDGQVLTADAAQATGLKWATPSGGGGGGNVGSTTVDFGAFPGASDAFVDVTGQGSIAAESIVQAWMQPLATADHSADEHMVETLKVYAGNIVAGDGFTIYVFNSSETNEPLTPRGMNPDVRISGSVQGAMNPSSGGQGTRIYGAWRVAWRWS
jgi:hypothetical protein